MDTLNSITPFLLNPYTGTIMLVIALGYIVRATPWIANRWIPAIGMGAGSLFFLVVAPLTMKADPEHAWNWYVMLWGAGLILSAFAWLIHKIVLTRIESYARTKIPALDKWLENTSDTPENKPPTTPTV